MLRRRNQGWEDCRISQLQTESRAAGSSAAPLMTIERRALCLMQDLYSLDEPEPWYVRRGAHKGALRSFYGAFLMHCIAVRRFW